MSKKAFTLVELMIVIAIIGILAAALFPSISAYMGRGRNAGRVADVKNINIGLKNYYYDFGKVPWTWSGSEGAICLGMNDTDMCWKEYVYTPTVAASKGRTNGIFGRSSFVNIMQPYVSRIPTDPLKTRSVGDRYIYSTAAGTIHCNGVDDVALGGFIIWQPEKVDPRSDMECLGRGLFGCCSGIGCGSYHFCLDQVDL